jgi:hypothetical protein
VESCKKTKVFAFVFFLCGIRRAARGLPRGAPFFVVVQRFAARCSVFFRGAAFCVAVRVY